MAKFTVRGIATEDAANELYSKLKSILPDQRRDDISGLTLTPISFEGEKRFQFLFRLPIEPRELPEARLVVNEIRDFHEGYIEVNTAMTELSDEERSHIAKQRRQLEPTGPLASRMRLGM